MVLQRPPLVLRDERSEPAAFTSMADGLGSTADERGSMRGLFDEVVAS